MKITRVITLEVLHSSINESQEQEFINGFKDLEIKESKGKIQPATQTKINEYIETYDTCTLQYAYNGQVVVTNDYGSYFYGTILDNKENPQIPEKVIAIGYREISENISHVYLTF